MATDPTADVTSDAAAVRAEVLDRLERSWRELAAAQSDLDEARLTATGPDGWSVKDHLTHLARWEEYLLAVLEGGDGRAALGVSEDEEGNEDLINGRLQRRDAGMSLAEARQLLRETHDRVFALLRTLDGSDLISHRRHIEGNTSGHYEQHAGWIRELPRTV
jgi:uncharacterized damage-inducible protein DinB